MAFLRLENLEIFYGSVQALKGISLTVNEGEVVALLGANGAGKTTTLRAISGLVGIERGEIHFDGELLNSVPAHEIVGRGIAHAPEGRKIFSTLTVEENLNLGGYSRGKDKEGLARTKKYVFELFPRLSERKHQLAGTLSGGEQQMLAISRALMAKPRMLLLDEPSLGLAPLLVQNIFATIKEINEEGMTILLVEQNAKVALKTAHRGYVLETGKIVLEGTAQDLIADERVRKAYLGEK